MSSPLRVYDLLGNPHVEPSVTGLIEVETIERVNPNPVNTLFILSAFRSGQPNKLNYFQSIAPLANYHDPDRSGDQGVALARMSKAAFADEGVFGSALIGCVRVGAATQSISVISQGGTDLISVNTADFGSHTRRSQRLLGAGTHVGKKIQLRDDRRRFTGDNLGDLLTLQYVGNGSACSLTMRRQEGVITYTNQPTADVDYLLVNGQAFGFGTVPNTVPVAIGGSADETFANLVSAIVAQVPGVVAQQDTAQGTVTVSGQDEGVLVAVGTGLVFSASHSGDAQSLHTQVTGSTDGSTDLAIPLGASGYKSISQLAAYLNQQNGYQAHVSPYANKFLASTGMDPVQGQDIKTAAYHVMGVVAALVDWINTRTRGNYVAQPLAQGTPDNDNAWINFTGGATPMVVAQDWENAMAVLSAEVQLGGLVLWDTDDPTIMAMAVEFVEEMRAAGKWFRNYFGSVPGISQDSAVQLTGELDQSRSRLYIQRASALDSNGNVTYLPPIYTAAAFAGGSAGNLPYVNPLTNKRLRFPALHEDDSYDLPTRESLLEGGITILKREEDRIVCTLHVSCSHDPDRRMVRVVSEIDCVDMIDSAMRQAFLPFRGKWAGVAIAARVFGVGGQVLNRFAREGAIIAGVDEAGNPRRPWNWLDPAFTIQAGLLSLNYQIFIGGELSHVFEHGRADYQLIVGTLGGSVQTLSTSVPVR